MKLIEMKCKNCGALLKVEENSKKVDCNFCNTSFLLDDETTHIKYDNAYEAGYEFEKGRIDAMNDHSIYVTEKVVYKKKKPIGLLVLGWICLFPFFATYYIIKSKKLNIYTKIVILVIMWLFFLLVGSE